MAYRLVAPTEMKTQRPRMVRLSLLVVLLSLLVGSGCPAYAQDVYFDHLTAGDRGTRMWIPPNVSTVKGILIYGNGAGGDSRDEVLTPWNRHFAALHDFALIGTSQWGNLSTGEIYIWDNHLSALATASGHPELVHAPWAPIGFSNGGQMSYGFNARRPEKTIAFITNKGCCYNYRTPSAAALATPGILIAGELDTATRRNSIQGLFDDNRPRGALWSWIEQEGEAHSGRADALVLSFMAEAIRLRYPQNQMPTASDGVTLLDLNESDGWLADQSTWTSGLTRVASYTDYSGNKDEAGWLLNRRMAWIYRAFSTYNHDVDLSFVLEPPLDKTDDLIEMWYQETTPADVSLRIDTSLVPDWTKIELFNYDELLLEITPSISSDTNVMVDVTLSSPGVYGLSALVTHADGVTVSTTDLIGVVVVPEPPTVALLCALAFGGLARRRRAESHLTDISHMG